MASPDRERTFPLEELLCSTTDRKGRIRSANDVFARVSGFPADELIGKAHNVIRHPDMPRAVFRTFWEALGAGRGVAAYVKNRAADGGHYWVLALSVPAGDGFLSVRLKPTSPLFAVAQRIYADVHAVEQRVEDGEPRRRSEAIEAGVARLGELLAAEGFASYRAFMHAALVAEVSARQEAIASASHAAAGAEGERDAAVEGALEACGAAETRLERLVDDLARYGSLAEQLGEKSAFVLGLAEEIRLFALNAVLASARLGERGKALGAVAEILGRRSDEAEPAIRALNDDLAEAVTLLGSTGFRIAASKLMTEMVGVLLDQLRASGASPATMATELAAIAGALADGAERLAASITGFAERVRAIEGGVRTVDGQLRVVRALEVNGRVEGARLDDTTIAQLFTTIARQVGDAREQLRTFAELAEAAGASDAQGDAAAIRAVVGGAAERVAALAG